MILVKYLDYSRAYHVAWCDNFRFDASIRGRAVGAKHSHRVDVSEPISAVRLGAIFGGGGDSCFTRRSSPDCEDVLSNGGACNSANRAAVVDVAVVAGRKYQQILRVLLGGGQRAAGGE